MTARPSILITGCSSGIGHHCAHALAARGWRVFASARKPEDVERLRSEGLEAIELDLASTTSIETAVETVLARTDGHLDALFNNGAYGQPGAIEDLSRDVLRAQLETNLLGWVELTNRVIPVMRRQGHGRIVQNSSVLGFVTLMWRGAYNTSKFALEGLTDTLRLELHGSGIDVILIQPGPIASRFRANAWQAYQRNISPAGSAHAETYRRLEQRLQSEDEPAPFTLGPEAVSRALIHALESRRPRARYRVTLPTTALALCRWLLPVRLFDRLLRRVSGT